MMWRLYADHERKHDTGDATLTWGLDARRPITEALQLRVPFEVGFLGHGLMASAPDRPGDDDSRFDAALDQTPGNATDLLE
jgi:hypothetical protein